MRKHLIATCLLTLALSATAHGRHASSTGHDRTSP